ncbi:CocE/NonD family hydrolase C-terminal non-catalytic domain-containing protein [Streptomyces xinghaiensis]|uniref:CocE/NonD family hydrolase C-terminal non-catalytic domain-containing protein n=1 Tax=Streptomyces xinghaiensis TaxID=1038928 RepID=UPI00067C63BB|nr:MULTISPECIES: CocE/NonD family hydrolase C-terminal non-catalytic domain-containing protein [Streptomyces]OFA58537.1 hypothetical protein BEN35_03660 [Streptomyces fradiae]
MSVKSTTVAGGVMIGNYNAGGVPQGQDLFGLVEWVAGQPWCDGSVGMIGISYFGSMQVLAAAERPPHLKAIKETECKPFHLRPRRKLSSEPEPMGAEHAAPDGFYQAPLTVTDQVEILDWSTEPFERPTELIGTGAAHLFAEIDQDDTNFILRLWDEAPGGRRQLITSGYLKASHHELDEERTTEGNPYHPHTRAVPVEPGTIQEYVLRLYPFAATFLPGHRLVVELSNDEPPADAHTRCCRRTPSTCRWAAPSPTRSTVTRHTPPGWCCRSRGPRRPRRRTTDSDVASPPAGARSPRSGVAGPPVDGAKRPAAPRSAPC